jgi:hypothetical protein
MDHSPSSGVEVRNASNYIFTIPYTFMVRCFTEYSNNVVTIIIIENYTEISPS